MFSFVRSPTDIKTHVYYALSAANLMLDVFYKSFPAYIKPQDPIPKDRHINLYGTDSNELNYLWTALMLLGPTGRAGFSAKTLAVNEYAPFKPQTELNFLGKFKAKSLYRKVFLPLLQGSNLKYSPDEMKRPFGYLVPDNEKIIREQVALLLCESLLMTYFSFNRATKTVVFDDVRYRETLHNIGSVKLSQTFFLLAEELIDVLDLNGMDSASLGILGCAQIIAFSRKMKRLNLDNNNLAQLGAEGLCHIFHYLAPSLSHLNLNNNGLSQFSESELYAIIQCIPPAINLSLDFNGLSPELLSRLMNARAKQTHQEPPALQSMRQLGLYTPES